MKNKDPNKLRVVVSRNVFNNPLYSIQEKVYFFFWKSCYVELHSPKKVREVLKSWGVNYKDVKYITK